MSDVVKISTKWGQSVTNVENNLAKDLLSLAERQRAVLGRPARQGGERQPRPQTPSGRSSWGNFDSTGKGGGSF